MRTLNASVNAMRGIMSLAVILFIALTAQAIAKTTVICEMKDGYRHTITFAGNSAGRLSFFTSDIPGCNADIIVRNRDGSVNDHEVIIGCFSITRDLLKAVKINRLTGVLTVAHMAAGVQTEYGTCRKAKLKF